MRSAAHSGEPDTAEVSSLLLAWSDGDQGALERLTPIVYTRASPAGRLLHAARACGPHVANYGPGS